MRKITIQNLKDEKGWNKQIINFYKNKNLEEIDWDLVKCVDTDYYDFIDWFLFRFKVKVLRSNDKTFEYDSYGKIVKIYDGIYNWNCITNKEGYIISMSIDSCICTMIYDKDNNVIEINPDDPDKLTQTFDGNGNITSIIDKYGEDRKWSWTYDKNNNMLTESFSNKERYSWIYDKYDNPVCEIDSNRTMTFFKNENNKIIIIKPWEGMEKIIYGKQYKEPLKDSSNCILRRTIDYSINLTMKDELD